MAFSPKDKSKIVAQSFPAFCLGGNSLKFVSSFKYLGHILTGNSRDVMIVILIEKLGICSSEPTL